MVTLWLKAFWTQFDAESFAAANCQQVCSISETHSLHGGAGLPGIKPGRTAQYLNHTVRVGSPALAWRRSGSIFILSII